MGISTKKWNVQLVLTDNMDVNQYEFLYIAIIRTQGTFWSSNICSCNLLPEKKIGIYHLHSHTAISFKYIQKTFTKIQNQDSFPGLWTFIM
jgi:hypothetical protein